MENIIKARICDPPWPGTSRVVNVSAGPSSLTTNCWVGDNFAWIGLIEKSIANRTMFIATDTKSAKNNLRGCPLQCMEAIIFAGAPSRPIPPRRNPPRMAYSC